MSDADAGAISSPTALSDGGGWTEVVRGRQPSGGSAAPDVAPAAAPAAGTSGARMGNTTKTHQAAGNASPVGSGGGGEKQQSAPKRSEPSPARTADAATLNTILSKLEAIGNTVASFGQRIDGVEQREAERVAREAEHANASRDERRGGRAPAHANVHAHDDDPSTDGGADDSEGESDVSSRASYASFDSEASSKEFLVVDPKRNKHWGARRLAHDDEAEPHRFSQHGNQVYDDLRASRAGAEGILGLGFPGVIRDG